MEWFEGDTRPDGRECPRCGYKYACAAKRPEVPYFCSERKKYFSVKIGTIMETSKIGCRKWAVAKYLAATSQRAHPAYSWARTWERARARRGLVQNLAIYKTNHAVSERSRLK